LVWSGEDDPKDTLVPRLLACGGDRSRIYFVGGVHGPAGKVAFDPARHLAELRREIERIGGIDLLLVDPIVSAVAGDSHQNAETRRGLQPIVDMAARCNCVAFGISHFSKGTSGRDPVERVTGSIAFGALPRMVFAAAELTEEDGSKRHIFVRAKSNISQSGGGFDYVLEQTDLPRFPGIAGSRVLWGKAIDGTARELLAVADESNQQDEQSQAKDATEWLRDVLRDGELCAGDIQKLCGRQGFVWRTVQRAKDRIGVVSRRKGFGADSQVMWRLPHGMPIDDKNAIDDSFKRVSPMQNVSSMEGNQTVEVNL
jgi:putative DNA primase/helicase